MYSALAAYLQVQSFIILAPSGLEELHFLLDVLVLRVVCFLADVSLCVAPSLQCTHTHICCTSLKSLHVNHLWRILFPVGVLTCSSVLDTKSSYTKQILKMVFWNWFINMNTWSSWRKMRDQLMACRGTIITQC